MDALFRIGVQWLHVTSGVLWIGGGFYTILVQLPALTAIPPAARGPVMANLVPRQLNYIFRVAEFTILTGLLNLFASGRAQELTRLDTRWSWAILAGIVLAVGIYAATRPPPPKCRSSPIGSAASATSSSWSASSSCLRW